MLYICDANTYFNYLWEINFLSHNACDTQTWISLSTAKNGYIHNKFADRQLLVVNTS